MAVVVHGEAGYSLELDHGRLPVADARRGAFFERVVGRAIEHWLAACSGEFHVFHDLVRLNNIGGGSKPLSLGNSNIDHLVLSSAGWLMIDAKGTGLGRLQVRSDGRGVLVTANGDARPQPWMDDQRACSRAGGPFRMTRGKQGRMVWVVANGTDITHPSLMNARFVQQGGICLLTVEELLRGGLDEDLADITAVGAPVGQRDVDEIRRYLSVVSDASVPAHRPAAD